MQQYQAGKVALTPIMMKQFVKVPQGISVLLVTVNAGIITLSSQPVHKGCFILNAVCMSELQLFK